LIFVINKSVLVANGIYKKNVVRYRTVCVSKPYSFYFMKLYKKLIHCLLHLWHVHCYDFVDFLNTM